MSTIGAIIAGGASRRFGSDKAEAPLDGRALLALAIDGLAPQVDRVVISGHAWPGYETLVDRPQGIGPLGGLAAALSLAVERGFHAVLAIPVDVHPLPGDLLARLGGGDPAVFADQHMIGLWPARLSEPLDRFVAEGGRAVHDWIDRAGARRVADPPGLVNINTPADLERVRPPR